MSQKPFYRCKECASSFPESLGKYGCVGCGGRRPAVLSEPQASKPKPETPRQGDQLIAMLKTRPMTVSEMVATGISRYPIKRVKECLTSADRLEAELTKDLDILYRVTPVEKSFMDEVHEILCLVARKAREALQ
jgi:hypothetical protein